MKTTAGPTLALLFLPALLGSAGCTVTAPPSDPVSAADTADAEPPPVPPMVLRLEEELAADPDHGPALYVLARYLGRTGDTERAVELLERLRDTDWDYALEHHDFEALADDPRFRAVETALAEREPRVGDAREEFTVGQQGLLSEGMAWDEQSGRFFVGAAEIRRVLVVTPDGTVEARWPSAGEEGEHRLLAPLGMDVDPRTRRLWVATAVFPFMAGYDEALAGRSQLVALDLVTGAVTERFEIGSADEPVVLNDLAVLPDGRVAVTDTQNGRVLLADPETDRLEPLTAPDAPLWSPNGIAVPPDEPDHLVVATFHGLARVDLDGTVTPLPTPAGVSLGGIDGLEPAGSHLVGIQNLPGRPRIWALSRPDDDGPIRAEILMSQDDRVSNSTTGAYVPSRGAFFYMANPFGGNEPVRMLSLPFDP